MCGAARAVRCCPWFSPVFSSTPFWVFLLGRFSFSTRHIYFFYHILTVVHSVNCIGAIESFCCHKYSSGIIILVNIIPRQKKHTVAYMVILLPSNYFCYKYMCFSYVHMQIRLSYALTCHGRSTKSHNSHFFPGAAPTTKHCPHASANRTALTVRAGCTWSNRATNPRSRSGP